jgi:hypothetical protein
MNNTDNQSVTVLERWTPSKFIVIPCLAQIAVTIPTMASPDRFLENAAILLASKTMQQGSKIKTPQSLVYLKGVIFVCKVLCRLSNLAHLPITKGYDLRCYQAQSFAVGKPVFKWI